MSDDTPNELYVMAIAQQPVLEKNAKTSDTLAIVQEQSEQYAKDLIGKGVFDDHDNTGMEENPLLLGQVKSAWVSPKGHIMAYARLSGETERGKALIKKVLSGHYKGCSLGSRHFLKDNKKVRSEPLEFTLCPKGAIEGSETLAVCASKEFKEGEPNVVTKQVEVNREFADGTKIQELGVFVGEQYMTSQFGEEKEKKMSEKPTTPNPSEQPAATPAEQQPSSPSTEEIAQMKKQIAEFEAEKKRLGDEATKLEAENKKMRAAEAERSRKETMKRIEDEVLPNIKNVIEFQKEMGDDDDDTKQMISALEHYVETPADFLEGDNLDKCLAMIKPMFGPARKWMESKNSMEEEEPAAQPIEQQQSIEAMAGKRNGFTQADLQYQQMQAKIEQLEKEKSAAERMLQTMGNQKAEQKVNPFSWTKGREVAKRKLEQTQPAQQPSAFERQQQTIEALASNTVKEEEMYSMMSLDELNTLYFADHERAVPQQQSNVLEVCASAGFARSRPVTYADLDNAAKRMAVGIWSKTGMDLGAPMVSPDEAKRHNRPHHFRDVFTGNPYAPDINVELSRNPEITIE